MEWKTRACIECRGSIDCSRRLLRCDARPADDRCLYGACRDAPPKFRGQSSHPIDTPLPCRFCCQCKRGGCPLRVILWSISNCKESTLQHFGPVDQQAIYESLEDPGLWNDG